MGKGAEYVKLLTRQSLSPLGEVAADILGVLYRGCHHIDDGALERVRWDNPRYISIVLFETDIATFDFNMLTNIVFLAHWLAVRISIKPKSHRYIEMLFHQRKRTGEFSQRHPSLDDAVIQFKELMANYGIEEVK